MGIRSVSDSTELDTRFRIASITKQFTAAAILMTGNHDVFRFAHAVRKAKPDAPLDEVMRRVRLAYAVILFSRGIRHLLQDEQGFMGEGDIDQDARQDMFPARVPSYRSEPRLKFEGTAISITLT